MPGRDLLQNGSEEDQKIAEIALLAFFRLDCEQIEAVLHWMKKDPMWLAKCANLAMDTKKKKRGVR
jgi:hypothetical protein